MCLSYFRISQDISSTLECQQTYLSSDEKIECRFHLHNNGNNTVSISKWFTPLDDVEFNYLRVTQNGQKVKYDGISHYRSLPPPSESYITIVPKGKVSTVFDLSKTYRIEEPGTFTVSVDIKALYLNTGSPNTSPTLSLRSPSVSFTLNESVQRKTSGEILRGSERRRRNVNLRKPTRGPLEANVVGKNTTKEKEELIKALSDSTYYYANVSALEVMEDEDHFRIWFGNKSSNRKIVRDNYIKIIRHLETKGITYEILGQQCESYDYAYTFIGSNTIRLCKLIFDLKPIATGKNLMSILSVMIHELAHVVFDADDIEYGKEDAAKLAKDDPSKAIINAENYEFFSITTYPFNFGIDAMTVLPIGYVYIMKDNFYALLDKEGDDPFTMKSSDFPKLLNKNWKNFDPLFKFGFDTVFNCGNEDSTFVTKSDIYARYSFGWENTVEEGYPLKLLANLRLLPKSFAEGFDSASHLPDGNTYITKGNKYMVFEDDNCSIIKHMGTITKSTWGNLPSEFMESFDSMMSVSGKTYVTKGKQYVRYSNKNVRVVDEGYPKSIRGNFGKANEYRNIRKLDENIQTIAMTV